MVNLDNIKSVAIIGDTNTGKTNLAFSLLNNYEGDRDIYLLGYPKKIKDYKEVSNLQDVFQLTDSIIFVDEIQRFIKIYDRKANNDLMDLISLFAHNNNTIVFTTQLSQFITKGVEAFIDCWLMTRIADLATLKNGSKPKRIIQRTIHPTCTKWTLGLEKGEYLEYSEFNDISDNGVNSFKDQKIGKDWKGR